MGLRYAGCLHLPGELYVTPDTTGTSYACTADQIDFTVTFPTLPEGATVGTSLEPPFPSPRWNLVDQIWGRDGENSWGTVTSLQVDESSSGGSTGTIIEVAVAGLGFLAESELWPEGTDAGWIGLHSRPPFSTWYRRARQWFELWTPQQLLRQDNFDWPEAQMWLDDDGDTPQGLTGWRRPMGPIQILSDEEILTPQAITSGFDRASAGEVPPLEWLLYLNGFRNSDPRQALLQVATAVEVASQKVFEQKFGSIISKEGLDRLVQQANGLVGLTRIVREFGTQLPSNNKIVTKLSDIRNAAIHSGREPTPEELSEAFKVARNILDATSPMPRW